MSLVCSTELCYNNPAKFRESSSKCFAAHQKNALWHNFLANHDLAGMFLQYSLHVCHAWHCTVGKNHFPCPSLNVLFQQETFGQRFFVASVIFKCGKLRRSCPSLYVNTEWFRGLPSSAIHIVTVIVILRGYRVIHQAK